MNEQDYINIIMNNIPLIDVRAPIEYNKGAFLNATNLPLLFDEEREKIGIIYKEKGQKEAIKLGYQLISGETKKHRVDAWVNHIKMYPNSMIYCFRGGQRSKITQEWIKEAMNMDVPKLEGGYKAFRNFLIRSLEPDKQNSKPLLIGGYTGAGKTDLLKQFNNFIDLENIAHHRGSSFGKFISPQPTQINFENNLAYTLIKQKQNGYKYLLLEDESRNIGKCFIPKPLFQYFKNGDLVILDISFQERLLNTTREYVIDSQKDYRTKYGDDEGLMKWYNYIETSITKIKKRLGGDSYNRVIGAFNIAFKKQIQNNDPYEHTLWIEIVLKEYYDPMYEYQMKKYKDKIIFKGNKIEVKEYLNTKVKKD